jgi:hypothetical protein
MSKDLKLALIRAFYGFMEMEMEGYNIYVDTPENRFRNTHGSIWIVNPNTKEWFIELKKSGKLWYYYQFYNNFLNWFNEELSVFEQLITMWVEDVLKKGVSTTMLEFSSSPTEVEDVLKKGVSTTSTSRWKKAAWVEDVLKNGVSTTILPNDHILLLVEDVLKRGIKLQ